ncbi:hypothetical protein BJV77DRAFT_1001819, partial [Russula vinacea]
SAYYLASRGLVFAFCLLAMSTLTPTDAAEKDPLLHCHPLGTFSGRLIGRSHDISGCRSRAQGRYANRDATMDKST